MVNTNVPTINKKATNSNLDLSSQVGLGWVEINLPIRTFSEANSRDHWTIKANRYRRQKGVVALALKPLRNLLKMPCHITMTRFAPRKLDQFDNLPMSLKYILDSCCAIITGDERPGRADGHEGLIVTYNQIISKEYGVKVLIQNL